MIDVKMWAIKDTKKEVEEHGKGSLSNRYNFLNSGGFSFYYQD